MALLGGCGDHPQRVNSAAQPVGGISAANPAPANTTPSNPTAGAPIRAAATTPAGTKKSAEPRPTDPATTRLVFGPAGLGALKLGMTRTQAVNTGLLIADGPIDDNGPGCNAGYEPKAAGNAEAPVFLSDRGLVSITAYPGVATPEGIKLGSKVAAAHRSGDAHRSSRPPTRSPRQTPPRIRSCRLSCTDEVIGIRTVTEATPPAAPQPPARPAWSSTCMGFAAGPPRRARRRCAG